MKASLIGFTLEGSTPLTIEELWTYLAANHVQGLDYSKAKRYLYLAIDDDNVYALLLSTKSHRKACELIDENGILKVAVTEIGTNSDGVDFNFLIARRATMKGVYLQYRGSWGLTSFMNFLHARYNAASRAKRDAEVAEVEDGPNSDAANDVKSKYKEPSLDHTVIMRKENLPKMLRRLKSLGRFTFPLTTLTMAQPTFIPLKGLVKSEHHTIGFAPTASKAGIIQGIVKTIENAGIASGRIYGKNAAGLDDFVDLVDNPDVFETYEFDQIADEQNFDLNNVASSRLMRTIRERMDAHSHIFDV